MPSCDNQRYIEDLIMGENGEIDAHPHLNARFGELKRTTYTYARIDYTNDKYIIELKTRSCNHNAFDRDGGLMFNYSKIKDYQKKEDKRKLIFAFNCLDGLYFWEYKEENYTTGIGGRKDRGCEEIRKVAKVKSKDMECLYKKPNPFDTYCFISSDEED
tara:strand:+ start:6014 stop:6490 length:477 start_codon:yes stop_codon:yes gene_type:complete